MQQPPKVTPTELARRLCAAGPHPNALNPPIPPCPKHITSANHFWGLTQPGGQLQLQVIYDVARENAGG